MYEFKLPDLGEGIHEGEVLKWHVQPGEEIGEDDPLVDVETDKAAVTIPSPKGGKIVSVTGEPGDIVHTGSVIAVIDLGAGAAFDGESEAPAAQPEAAPEPATAPAPAAPPAAPAPRREGGKVAAAPSVRRLAREKGIDIEQVVGSGPGGRVTAEDLEAGPAAAELPEKVADFGGGAGVPFLEVEELPDFSQWGPVEVEPLRSIRRKVARKMVSSMLIVPHVAHMDEVDVTELVAYRRREKERGGSAPTLMAFVMKALARTLQRFPEFNSSLDPHRQAIVRKGYFHLGFATDTDRGLLVPVIRDVDRKDVNEIGEEIVELAGKARDGSVQLDELRGGTFSVTNIGALGGTGLIPTINYPEVAILGMGKVQEKPVVREGEIVVRHMLPLTLAFDHRVTDGANAARFVNDLMAQLEEPARMI